METQTEYPMTLNGKRIVVLGGTSGIGFATAAMAAREGAAMVVASSRREHIDRAVASLPKGTEGYALDLANEVRVLDFFAHLGAFDHLGLKHRFDEKGKDSLISSASLCFVRWGR